MKGCVFNIQRFSVHDGPGIRTNVFLKGCPLHCLWCHNPEGLEKTPQIRFSPEKCIACGDCAGVCKGGAHVISENRHAFSPQACLGCMRCPAACPAQALEAVGELREASSVLEEIMRDTEYYGDDGGMTLTGGEPFYQPEFALELLRLAKEKNLNCAVETCGFAPGWVFREAVKYVDTFLFDFKHSDEQEHLRLTGASNRPILENLALLNELGARIILRCPIIPTINDNTAHYKAIAALAERYETITEVHLMPYHSIGIGKGEKLGIAPAFRAESMSYETAEGIQKEIQKYTDKPVRVI